jgi:branched-chain amino acid transport system substrate-binding protein
MEIKNIMLISHNRGLSKTITIIIAVVIVVGIVSGGLLYYFGLPSAPTEETIKIGMICPFSPPGSYTFGANIRKSLDLGLRVINEEGGALGKKIEIVYGDSEGIPEKGVAAAKRLILEDEVVAIGGVAHSSVALSVQETCEEYGVPFVPSAASNKDITAKHLATTYRIHPIDPGRAAVWLEFAKELGFNRIAMMVENTDFGIGLADAVKDQKDDLYPEAEIFDVVFDRESMDYTSFLLQIDAWGPDLIVDTSAALTNIARVCTQAYDIDLYPRVPIVCASQEPSLPEFWETVEGKGKYLMFMTYYHPAMTLTPLGEKIVSTYEDYYEEEAFYVAVAGWGHLQLIVDAIKLAGSSERADILNALNTGSFTNYWYPAPFEFTEGEGPFWHQSSPPFLMLQYTEVNQNYADVAILYPEELKTQEMARP